MKIPHDKFCILPWVSLEASPIGTVRPCCLADDELVNDAGEKFNLNTATFKQIQDSNNMKSLRQEFLTGKQPTTCRKCWNEEDSGRTSKRMHTLNRLKHIVQNQEWTEDARPLLFLDLKLGNICNLKCRICGSWSSSQFAAEELKFTDRPKESFHYQMLKQGAWPRENQMFWQEIELISDQIQYIEFTGGEPFMIEEHFDMLRGLVARGIAGQIEIHYNTNGTQFPDYAEDIWRHFKLVEIAISIDDIGARFEYQRTNAVWKEVYTNLEKFKQLRRRNSNIELQACCTVNIFNVYYLETVANWLDRQGFNFVYWNMMHDAAHFSISHLPVKVKQAVTKKLKSAHVSKRSRQEFDFIIEFMNNNQLSLGGSMMREIIKVDQRRNQYLKDVAPELAKLLNYD